MQGSWQISIDTWDGLVPGFFNNSYPSLGNKGHASDMQNISLMDHNVLTQGPGLANLTAGTEAGAMTTLMKGIQKISVAGTYAYGVGGNKLYQFTSAAVTNDATWPHTIDKAVATGEDGEDVCYYNGNTYYSYNHSGSAGDIGRYTGAAFDDDYMSTVPTGATTLVGGVPHQMIVGGDNKMYIANGRYIASLSVTTFVDQALDFPEGSVVTSIAWNNARIYAAVVRPYVATATYQESSVYTWDTSADSWEYQISVPGRVSALFVRNGVVHCWYRDVTTSGGLKLAIVNGTQIQDLAAFTGTLPEFYQVIDDKNHLLWLSGGEVWAWGAPSSQLPTKLFQYADAGYVTAGGITNAFATPMIASTDATHYRFAQFSGYDVNATYSSILYHLSDAESTARLTKIIVYTEQLAVGAQVDMDLKFNYGATEDTDLVSIAYDVNEPTKTRWVVQRQGMELEGFRFDLTFAAGSATNPVKIRKIVFAGEYVTDL